MANRTAKLSLCIVALLSLTVACSREREEKKTKPPVLVKTAAAIRKTVPVQLRVIGTVEAVSTVAVKAQVNGMLEKVHFLEGEDVHAGQLLFTIDSRPFNAALRQAKAALARDIAQEKFARNQASRYGELVKDGIVTQDQYEQLRANADALAETVRADRAAVYNAEIQVGYCSIRSPLGGRAGSLAVHAGNLVKANDNPVLVNINQISPILVGFSVPEKDLARIMKYKAEGTLKVEAQIQDASGHTEQGDLSFLDNAVDSATGTFRVKGKFPNRDKRLWPGQFVTVTLTLTSISDAVTVPSQAVQTGQQGQYVFVVKRDRTVESRPVATGIGHGGETVIEKGINPGDLVVTDGHLQLVPGARVTIKREPDRGTATRQ
jgi:multidrug efflux system membrane fusion protein